MKRLIDLLEMIRFSHTLFALPFALASAILAWRREPFRWLDLLGIVLCMVFARSAAMAFNRLADRDVDAANPRTATRHLPTGRLTVAMVALFTVIAAVAFIMSTLLFVVASGNWFPFWLSVPVLLFIGLYSLTKRFTAWSHFWLGGALLLAPVSAWIAIAGTIESTPLFLGLALLFWVAGFDILYACQDAEFDRAAGLHSLPARLGVARSLKVAMACHAVMIGMLLALWHVADLGWVYLGGVAGVTALLAYEHWLVRPSDLTRVNLAFFQVNVVISLGLLVVVALDAWLGA